MKTFFQIACGVALLIATAAPSMADTYVRGYTRQNGTYVAPHYRSSPDSSIYNNYSTYPNVNPYTGQQGTVNPYSSGERLNGSSYGQRLNGSNYGQRLGD